MTIEANDYLNRVFGEGALRVSARKHLKGYIGEYDWKNKVDPLQPTPIENGGQQLLITEYHAMGHFRGMKMLPGYRMVEFMALLSR